MNPMILVPHTHWDRAWYLPFESYRHRLVRFVDRLLETLEKNKDFSSFTLDGQTVILDDYLEIRPENRSRIEALVRSKKIEIGPWYTLPDLFLSSGECLIRNLEMGLRHARSFGGGMRVGYVPDPFGHPAELVQILAGFQIDSFIFMRGLEKKTKDELGSHFNWCSPSGAKVLAVYQLGGYLDASALGFPEQWGRNEGFKPRLDLALDRINQALATAKQYQKEQTVLLSNGCDHMPVQENLPEILSGLKHRGLDIKIGTFREYVDSIKSENLSHGSFSGDLLGNADHPILSSVWSTHVKLKQLNRECEKTLTRYLEPLQLLFSGIGPDQNEFTESAWKKLLKNQAHDDICGCSHDEVHHEDEARFHRIKRLSEGLIREKLEHLQMAIHTLVEPSGEKNNSHENLKSQVFLFNPHPFEVSQRVRLKVLMANPKGEFAPSTPAKNLRALSSSNEMIGLTLLETNAPDIRNQFLETTWGRSYSVALNIKLKALERKILTIEEYDSEEFDSEEFDSEEFDSAEFDPNPEEPALNHPDQLAKLSFFAGTKPLSKMKSKDDKEVKNKIVGIAQYGWTLKYQNHLELLSPFSSRSLIDFISFEWEEDRGDTYSASITPNSKMRSTFLEAFVFHDGVRAIFEMPLSCAKKTSVSGSDKMLITADFTIDGPVGLTTRVSYDNQSRGGRLRMLVDPGFEAKFSVADGHFRLVSHEPTPLSENHHAPRAYPGELTYDTKHMAEFVFVEGTDKVWIGARGHAEYELTKAGLAITLHRSIGMLSVGGGRIRGCQAGPSIATPAAQCLGYHEHTFAIGFGDLDRLSMIRSLRMFSTPILALEVPYLRYLGIQQPSHQNSSHQDFSHQDFSHQDSSHQDFSHQDSSHQLRGNQQDNLPRSSEPSGNELSNTQHSKSSSVNLSRDESEAKERLSSKSVIEVLSHSEIVLLDQCVDLTSFRNVGLYREFRLYNQTTEPALTTILIKEAEKLEKINFDHSQVLKVIEPIQADAVQTLAEQALSNLSNTDRASHEWRAFCVYFKPSEIITLRYT